MKSAALLVPLTLTAAASLADLRRREIPDAVPIAVVSWGVVALAVQWSAVGWMSAAAGEVLGVTVGLLLFASGGFGGGDAKLIASLGLTLGLSGTTWTLLYMAVAGGVLGLLARARGRRTLAYGPAICLGLLAYVVKAWNG